MPRFGAARHSDDAAPGDRGDDVVASGSIERDLPIPRDVARAVVDATAEAVRVERHIFDGVRTEVKRRSTEAALAMVRDLILDNAHGMEHKSCHMVF